MLDDDLDGSFRGALGDRVRVLLHRIGHLAEELVEGDESGTANIPMGLLDLSV